MLHFSDKTVAFPPKHSVRTTLIAEGCSKLSKFDELSFKELELELESRKIPMELESEVSFLEVSESELDSKIP